jgi:endo-1,4-beta-xylanase
MHRRKSIILSLAVTVIMAATFVLPAGTGASAATGNSGWDLTLDSLKDSFADYFVVGNIMEPRRIRSATDAAFVHHYNFVTAENAMKPSSISRAAGQYSFSDVDVFMTWAEDLGLGIIGHTLVWHSQSPAWLTSVRDADGDYEPITRAEAQANMQEYINTVAGRYSGRIHAWDVVNEAFTTSLSSVPASGDWRDALRKTIEQTDGRPVLWYAAYANGADREAGECGSDYLYDAFVFTRLADPHAILYYNDFNETESGKREVIALMTEELNERWKSDPRNEEPERLLVEGLGLQAHYWTSDLNPASVELTIRRWIETGAEISITELDIPLGRWRNWGEPNEANFARQAELYEQVFNVFLRYSNYIERVTFWGMIDTQSWRDEGNPLLFDGQLQAKPSFFSVLNAVNEFNRADLVYIRSEAPEIIPEPEQPDEAGEASESAADDAPEPAAAAQSDSDFSPIRLGGIIVCVLVAIVIFIAMVKKKK